MRGGHRWRSVAVGAALLSLWGGLGCVHTDHHKIGPGDNSVPVAVPPPGAVPRELDKITLPPYVIEAPDQLLIEVVQRSKVSDKASDKDAKGMDKDAAERPVTERLTVQPVSGPFQVRPDGSVYLGFWGSVPVAGLTLEQAAEAIRNHIAQNPVLKEYSTDPRSLVVILDVLAYNSKRYYVFFDGAGVGEQVLSFPVTGNETVLDAIANIGGLSAVASKRNIWVARRTPHPGQPLQILPVDWVGISQHGITVTNYQLLPGDRLYVKAQRLVLIDNTLARIFAPIERVFGITLLGASTVNQISGRGFNNNNNNNFNNP